MFIIRFKKLSLLHGINEVVTFSIQAVALGGYWIVGTEENNWDLKRLEVV